MQQIELPKALRQSVAKFVVVLFTQRLFLPLALDAYALDKNRVNFKIDCVTVICLLLRIRLFALPGYKNTDVRFTYRNLLIKLAQKIESTLSLCKLLFLSLSISDRVKHIRIQP